MFVFFSGCCLFCDADARYLFRYATPTHANGQQQNGGAGKLGELTVATASPNPAGRSANGGGDVASLPLMTFTPPGASPDTSKLLGQLGIKI